MPERDLHQSQPPTRPHAEDPLVDSMITTDAGPDPDDPPEDAWLEDAYDSRQSGEDDDAV